MMHDTEGGEENHQKEPGEEDAEGEPPVHGFEERGTEEQDHDQRTVAQQKRPFLEQCTGARGHRTSMVRGDDHQSTNERPRGPSNKMTGMSHAYQQSEDVPRPVPTTIDRSDADRMIDELERSFARIEPDVEAFIPEEDRFSRLRARLETLFDRHPKPEDRPPLFGTLLGVKDIFNVQGFETRAGTTLPPETFEGAPSPVVERLQDAGAILVGKTVTAEFAFIAPGPTRNPHDLEHTPGGSSSGSAAAVAAGLCDIAIGTQTVGSIIRPAAYCGVHGFKPSYEAVDRSGCLALAPSFDHVGCFARTIEEIRVAHEVMSDTSMPRTTRTTPPRLGVPSDAYLQASDGATRAHFGMVCELLRNAGFELVKTDLLSDFDDLHERHMDLCAVEASEVHRSWRARHQRRYDPRTLALLDRAEGLDDARRDVIRASPLELRASLESMMTTMVLDAWIAPAATGCAPMGLGETGDGRMNGPWTHGGVPTVAIPAGRNSDGLPIGLQIAGRFMQDASLLDDAEFIDRVIRGF